MLRLHQADGADWDHVPAENWNFWQRQAAASKGMIAPANFVSLVGALIVVYGLYALTQGSLLPGLIAILIGRAADILDGAVADWTGTKSATGETVDAVIDKLLLAGVVFLLFAYSLVPFIVGLFLLLHVFYNTSLSAISVYRQVRLHPSKTGKLGTAFEWICIGLFILARLGGDEGQYLLATLLIWTAIICFGLFVTLFGYSSYVYTRQLAKGRSNAHD